jgi:hypothetical protein
MELPIDFVAALTSEPSVDFVSALSAEQGCDICHELHASVYEMRCSTCEAAICPDCARLRPDTTMTCLICNARRPGRAVETIHRSRPAMLVRLREEAATLGLAVAQLATRLRAGEGVLANLRLIMRALWLRLREHDRPRLSLTRIRALSSGLPVRDALTASARRARELSSRALAYSARAGRAAYAASARGTSSARALSSRVHERASIVVARSRGNALTASRRATVLTIALSKRGHRLGLAAARQGATALRTSGAWLGRHGARAATHGYRASSAFGAGARRGWARSRTLGARGLVYTRAAAVQGWVALRSLPVRHHTTALLLATLLLYAVARADHRD